MSIINKPNQIVDNFFTVKQEVNILIWGRFYKLWYMELGLTKP